MTQQLTIDWQWFDFNSLTTSVLYDLLKLRQDVFIIEQACIYPDLDGIDKDCLHLLGYQGRIAGKELIAYLRLIPANIHSSGNIAIGRVISKASQRGAGIGSIMMAEAMQYCHEHFPKDRIQLSAQAHLVKFYKQFGFEAMSEPYDEDGIMHIDMLYQENLA